MYDVTAILNIKKNINLSTCIYLCTFKLKLTKARTPLEFVNIINHPCFFFLLKKKFSVYES